MAESAIEQLERRRLERRFNARLGDVTVPELRRMVVTSVLFTVVLLLFLWMVRTVIIAGFLGVVVAFYLRPVYEWLVRRLRKRAVAAITALFLLVGPILGLVVYSYTEVATVASYVDANQAEITAKIDSSVRRLPFLGSTNTSQVVGRWVIAASNYGAEILGTLRAALKRVGVAAAIFMFTAFYLMVDWERVIAYIKSKVPPRYSRLGEALQHNVRGVLYGAVYSTVITQAVKSVIILAMNLVFQVPLAAVLALVSFVVGFFPIVGSWTIYLPVAAYLAIFRNAPGQGVAMVLIGFFVNTLYISTFLRPKLAAERSKVLNFYWMFVGLVTGVYTFGLVGILLGPILIGLLKAILDTITEMPVSDFVDHGGDAGRDNASTLRS
jgi:predicted PurR-regulated permease PerM